MTSKVNGITLNNDTITTYKVRAMVRLTVRLFNVRTGGGILSQAQTLCNAMQSNNLSHLDRSGHGDDLA